MRTTVRLAAMLVFATILAGCPATPTGDNTNNNTNGNAASDETFVAERVGSLTLTELLAGLSHPLALNADDSIAYVGDGATLRVLSSTTAAATFTTVGDQRVVALAVLGDGTVATLTAAGVTHYSASLAAIGETLALSTDSNTELVHDPTTGLLYARNGLDGAIHEIDPDGASNGGPVLLRTINFRAPQTNFPGSFSNQMDIDPPTQRLFVMDSFTVTIVDLSGTSTSQTPGTLSIDGTAEGLIVDADRRRLYVNLLFAEQASTSDARVRGYDLDTLEQRADLVLGNQIHWMALDAPRGRLAVLTRETTSFSTPVFLLDLADLSKLDFELVLEDEGEGGTIHAQLAIDATNNRLLVARDGTPPRVEVYSLP